jgi:hypothetical protein
LAEAALADEVTLADGVGLIPGQRVEVSVAARGLTDLCMRLLGPPLLWILAWALVLLPGGEDQTPAIVGLSHVLLPGIGLAGLVVALYYGRHLTAQAARVLDLRVEAVTALSEPDPAEFESVRKLHDRV